MKKFITTLIICFSFLTILNAQKGSPTNVKALKSEIPSTTIVPAPTAVGTKNVFFPETQFEFGKIKVGIPVTHNFVFENRDTQPIVIADVRTGCSCTTPVYPKQPILKGQKNQINVGYNAAHLAKFQRTIYVTIDGETTPRELYIQGEVIE